MNFAEKVLEKAVDIVLISIFFNLETLSTSRKKDWGRIQSAVESDLINLNYQKIKQSISYLKRKGLIQAGREKFSLPQITAEGEKKLLSILPKYDQKRVWNNRVYLITYDLPVNKNKERNSLRFFLKKIGCGMLQKSVWITPYNPTLILEKFTKEKNLSDLILVSSLAKDGTIGGKDLIELFAEIYKLPKINEEYKEFIYNSQNNTFIKEQLIFLYLNILGKDPQLPFPLLPDWWIGDKAYKYFLKLTTKNAKKE